MSSIGKQIRKQIINKKIKMRKIISKVREACAGSACHYYDYKGVKSLVAQARLDAFNLGLGNVEEQLKRAHNVLIPDGDYNDRVIADGVLCDILNRLDKEINSALV